MAAEFDDSSDERSAIAAMTADLQQAHAIVRDNMPKLAELLYGSSFDESDPDTHLLVAAAKIGMNAFYKEGADELVG